MQRARTEWVTRYKHLALGKIEYDQYKITFKVLLATRRDCEVRRQRQSTNPGLPKAGRQQRDQLVCLHSPMPALHQARAAA